MSDLSASSVEAPAAPLTEESSGDISKAQLKKQARKDAKAEKIAQAKVLREERARIQNEDAPVRCCASWLIADRLFVSIGHC